MAYTKTAYSSGYGEITEKKSRFIANVQPVSSEQEALDFIAKMKKPPFRLNMSRILCLDSL